MKTISKALLFISLCLPAMLAAQNLPHKVRDKPAQDNFQYLHEQVKRLNLGSVSGPYILKTDAFGGDVSSTYDALVVTNDSHNHGLGTLPTVNSVLGAHEAFISTSGTKMYATGIFITTATSRIDALLAFRSTATTIIDAHEMFRDTATYWYIDPYGAALSTAGYLPKTQIWTGDNRWNGLSRFVGKSNFEEAVSLKAGSSMTIYDQGMGVVNSGYGGESFYIVPTGDIWVRFGVQAASLTATTSMINDLDTATTTTRNIVNAHTAFISTATSYIGAWNQFASTGPAVIGAHEAFRSTATSVIDAHEAFRSTATSVITAHAAALSTAVYQNEIATLSSATIKGTITSPQYRIGNIIVLSTVTSSTSLGVGHYAGENNTGNNNTYVGYRSGRFQTSGYSNTLFGADIAYGVATPIPFSSSTIVGAFAGNNITTGDDNILVGYKAGDLLVSGSRNVIVGYDIDPPADNTSDHLNIAGLIFGSIGSSSVTINNVYSQNVYAGNVADSTETAIVFIATASSYTGAWNAFASSGPSIIGAHVAFVSTASSYIGAWNVFAGTGPSHIGAWNAFASTGPAVIGAHEAFRSTATSVIDAHTAFVSTASTKIAALGIGITTAASITADNTFTGTNTFTSSITITGNAFSVGGTTLAINNGQLAFNCTGPFWPTTSFDHFDMGASTGKAPVLDFTNSIEDINGRAIGAFTWTDKNNTGASTVSNKRLAAIQVLTNGDVLGNRGGMMTIYTRAGGGTGGIAERLRIDATGYVGIGQTAPAYLLDVGRAGSADNTIFRITDADGSCVADPESTGSPTWTCTSDSKFKKDIRPATSALVNLLRYQIRNYEARKWKDYGTDSLNADGETVHTADYQLVDSTETKTGVIAQEVEIFAPDKVKNWPTGKAVESPGVWELVKAIQELDARIAALEKP